MTNDETKLSVEADRPLDRQCGELRAELEWLGKMFRKTATRLKEIEAVVQAGVVDDWQI